MEYSSHNAVLAQDVLEGLYAGQTMGMDRRKPAAE